MTQLTGRQQTILGYLLGLSSPVPVRTIAERCGLSERTIRYDLDAIMVWLRYHGGELRKKPNSGVAVEIPRETRAELLRSFSGDTVADKILSSEERSKYIQYALLFSSGYLTADSLARQLLVSRPTVVADLRRSAQWLRANRLDVESKKGEGVRLSGSEEDMRACITDGIIGLLAGYPLLTKRYFTNQTVRGLPREGGVRNLALDYLAEEDMDSMAALLASTREVVLHTMPESDHLRFLIYMLVTVRRVRDGETLPHGKAPATDAASREIKLAKLLVSRVDLRFRLRLDEWEIGQLAVWLIACNAKFPPRDDDKLMNDLSSIVDEMLEVMAQSPGYNMPDFYRDKLRMNLLSHLKLTIKKHNLNIPSPNPLLTQMKVNYPEIFLVVYKMAEVFETRTAIALNEDELGFIAIHIAASIEECSKLIGKKALIVCNTGRGAGMVLYNRIRNNIPRLEIVGTLAALDASENADVMRSVDFVISTVELPELEKPVFRVSPIISATQIENINKYVNGQIDDKNVRELRDNQSYMLGTILQITDKYVQPEDSEKLLRELESAVGLLAGAPAAADTGYREQTAFRCAMILAKLGSITVELKELYGLDITAGQIFGVAIHLLMSIPRWEKGVYCRERDSDRIISENKQLYEHIVQLLHDASKEYGITIPDSEAIAMMRYFL